MSIELAIALIGLVVAILSPFVSVALAYFSFKLLTEWRLTQLEKKTDQQSELLTKIVSDLSLIMGKLRIAKAD